MQHYALVVLDYLDRLNKSRQEDREIRLALLASGSIPPAVAFPEIFGEKEETVEDEEDLPDDQPVKMIFTDDAPMDQQSIEKELRELALGAATGSLTFEKTYSDWV